MWSIYLSLIQRKFFSNMRRVGKGFSNTVTRLFFTMMVLTDFIGEGSGSQHTSMTSATDPQPIPFSTNIPSATVHEPLSPSLQTYKRSKVKKVPSLLASLSPQLESPQIEHTSFENIQREPTRVYPNPKKVVYKELGDHLERVHTTVGAQGAKQASMNIAKTQSKATLGVKSQRGPRCQETTVEVGASAR